MTRGSKNDFLKTKAQNAPICSEMGTGEIFTASKENKDFSAMSFSALAELYSLAP